MHARLVLACAAIAAGSVSASAVAAPKPVCNLVTDAVGDEWEEAGSGVRPPGLSEPTMDIVSGDIASNSKWVTVAIRPKKIGTPNDPFESVTLRFSFRVNDKAQGFFFEATLAQDATTYLYGHFTSSSNTSAQGELGPATGVVDRKRGEVRISVPLAKLRSFYGTLDRSFHRFTLDSWLHTTAGESTTVGEGAQDVDASYRQGTRSCLTPGR